MLVLWFSQPRHYGSRQIKPKKTCRVQLDPEEDVVVGRDVGGDVMAGVLVGSS